MHSTGDSAIRTYVGERTGSRSSRHNGFNCPEKSASTLRKFGTTDAVIMRNARERYFHHSTRDSAILTNAGEFVGWCTGTEHNDSSIPLSSKYQCGCACLGLRRPLQLTRSLLRAAYAQLTHALRTPYSKRPLPDRSVCSGIVDMYRGRARRTPKWAYAFKTHLR